MTLAPEKTQRCSSHVGETWPLCLLQTSSSTVKDCLCRTLSRSSEFDRGLTYASHFQQVTKRAAWMHPSHQPSPERALCSNTLQVASSQSYWVYIFSCWIRFRRGRRQSYATKHVKSCISHYIHCRVIPSHPKRFQPQHSWWTREARASSTCVHSCQIVGTCQPHDQDPSLHHATSLQQFKSHVNN